MASAASGVNERLGMVNSLTSSRLSLEVFGRAQEFTQDFDQGIAIFNMERKYVSKSNPAEPDDRTRLGESEFNAEVRRVYEIANREFVRAWLDEIPPQGGASPALENNAGNVSPLQG